MKTQAHLITLGVADLAKSLAFYQRFGWKKALESVDVGVFFFKANGFVIGLYPQGALGKDRGGEGRAACPTGVTTGQNFESPEAMRAEGGA